MEEAVLVLPDQLFDKHPCMEGKSRVLLYEHPHFFTERNYHSKKLVFHRASMKNYQKKLSDRGLDVEYVEFEEGVEKLLEGLDRVVMVEPADKPVREELENKAEEKGVELKLCNSPKFLTERDYFEEFFRDRKLRMTPFYREQRKKMELLVDEEGKPEGGKWSFDPKNRGRMPEDESVPGLPGTEQPMLEEAERYVDENFPDSPGTPEGLIFPVTGSGAEGWLDDFLEHRLEKFGDYQDSFDRERDFLYHSLLSPMLNTGLITPERVVERTIERHGKKNYPLNSLEGFLRQIIGWREYVKGVYEIRSEKLENSNYWNFDRELPEGVYSGDTGIEPVDRAVKRVVETGYTHHIERLMVLGNYFLLTRTEPEEVFEWFSELFIDAYDWVMVPNVYGMSQYSAGGLIMTKPYISSSNYIKKMSHYRGDWEEILDGLYWSFVRDFREKIEEIPRMAVMASIVDRMDDEKLEEHIQNSEEYLENI